MRLDGRFNLSGKLHYCVPTLFLGAVHWVWRLGRRRRQKGGHYTPLSIIIFRLDAIGDVVLSSAMLRELRRLYPTAHITLVVSSTTRSLVEHCPYVDEVLDKPTGSYELRSLIGDLKAMVAFSSRQLRRRHWDLALVPRWDVDMYFATLMSLYAGATRRVAFTEKVSIGKRLFNWGFDTLCTDVLPPCSPSRHEVERGLDMVRYLGGQIESANLEVWLTPADEAFAARIWSDFGLAESEVVFAFGIGASQSRKRWPAKAFAELIDILRSRFEFTAALVYGGNEELLAREIQDHTEAKLLPLQRPSLREAVAFLSRCALFIGNDSGPKHMAAAAGIPVVEISCHPVDGDPESALNPHRFGPYTSRSMVVQPDRAKEPCSRGCSSAEAHCITQVSPAQVAERAAGLLHKYSALCVHT